jgi:glycosyltransferase involved in cell wall biosynthesis
VDAFIALTKFQKSVLVRGGLPERRICVKPNCYPGSPQPAPWAEREDTAVFLGRISPEKGIDMLVEAWIRWGAAAPKLQVIGGGPDLERLRRRVPASSRVVFVGMKPADEAHALLSRAKLLIVPSTWFEGFPLVLCEAFAFGVPVAASRLGTFEELVEAPGVGRLFLPNDPEDLLKIVSELWEDKAALERMSLAAHREFETRYSAQASAAALQSIYERAIETKRARLHTRDQRDSNESVIGFISRSGASIFGRASRKF